MYLWTMDSPVGPLTILASEQGLRRVDFGTEAQMAVHLAGQAMERRMPFPIEEQLREYFAGKRKDFDLPLDWTNQGTPFQLRCWEALLRIPYGQVVSYAHQARVVGSPKGFRAVGQANHHNPMAIVVPCHRVVTSDRKLGGYGGGLETKRVLLELEGVTL